MHSFWHAVVVPQLTPEQQAAAASLEAAHDELRLQEVRLAFMLLALRCEKLSSDERLLLYCVWSCILLVLYIPEAV